MIIIDKEVAEVILIGKEREAAIYLGAAKIWEGIRSCFGAGYWRGDKPWRGDEAWKH